MTKKFLAATILSDKNWKQAMSRSRKKTPFVGIARHTSEAHKKAKKMMQNSTRSMLDDEENLVNGSYYKKHMHSWHWRPDDGKRLGTEERDYRK